MRILCFGDSNTYGYDPRSFFGDRYDDRWPDLLAKRTGWEVLNAGANGRMIPRGNDLPHEAADVILIMLGTNDLLNGAAAEEAAARMERFLTRLLPQTLLLIAPPPMKRGAWVPSDELVRESLRLCEAYRKVAQKLCIPFIDTSGWEIELAFDGVHFTESGHRTFADQLATVALHPPAETHPTLSGHFPPAML